jgi:hypothetical protein
MAVPDFLTIVVSAEDVVSCNIAPTLGSLKKLLASQNTARHWYERVDFAVDGYNNVVDELFEIVEVRNFIQRLDEEFPYWLYFLSKRHTGLQCIAYSFLPPFLTQAAKAEAFPQQLDELLSRRWLPAAEHICGWVGMSESEFESLGKRCVEYLLGGPI